jgi:hypothetical protein
VASEKETFLANGDSCLCLAFCLNRPRSKMRYNMMYGRQKGTEGGAEKAGRHVNRDSRVENLVWKRRAGDSV